MNERDVYSNYIKSRTSKTDVNTMHEMATRKKISAIFSILYLRLLSLVLIATYEIKHAVKNKKELTFFKGIFHLTFQEFSF
jgi:hypothetical protein